MAILTLQDTPAQPGTHTYKTQSELETSTVFDKELPNAKIVAQISGMRWAIDYFNQILNVNTQPLAPDINIPSTTLKYNRIDNLDIYVDSGLPDGATIDITGTGTINAGFVPYIGDAFTATLAGGRIGIFVLTAVRKEYYNTHDIYVVDYKLTYFADVSAAIYNDLVYKTIRTYIYDREAIKTNGSPVILAQDYKIRIDLNKEPAKITKHYLTLFHDKNTKLLRLPTTTSVYSDELVVDALFKTMSVRDVPELNDVQRLSKHITAVTIWDAILNRDISLFSMCEPNIHYAINAVGTNASRKLSSYLGVEYGVTDNTASVGTVPTIKNNPLFGRIAVTPPITNPDAMYIFSNDFYVNTPGVVFSGLETSLMLYLEGKPPIRSVVNTLIKEYPYWSYKDQYNLLPILLILVKTLINTSYSNI